MTSRDKAAIELFNTLDDPDEVLWQLMVYQIKKSGQAKTVIFYCKKLIKDLVSRGTVNQGH